MWLAFLWFLISFVLDASGQISAVVSDLPPFFSIDLVFSGGGNCDGVTALDEWMERKIVGRDEWGEIAVQDADERTGSLVDSPLSPGGGIFCTCYT